MVLKFKKTLKEWIPFYVDAIKNRLRRDLNLSDVFDVQATRDNIGLSGVNNHTHYHDDRYIPKINKEIDTRKQEITSLNNKLATEHNERIAADDKEKNERVTSINSIQAALNKGIAELKKLCNDLKNRLDGNEFVKSKDNANNITLKYEQKDGESAKSLHAYVDGLEVPLTSQSGGIRLDYSRSIEIGIYNVQFVAPEDGMIFYSLPNGCRNFEALKAKIKINNVLILDMSMGEHGEQNGNAVIPISKGEIFSTEIALRGSFNVKNYFVPYKK